MDCGDWKCRFTGLLWSFDGRRKDGLNRRQILGIASSWGLASLFGLRGGIGSGAEADVPAYVRDLAEIEWAGVEVFGKPTVLHDNSFLVYRDLLRGLELRTHRRDCHKNALLGDCGRSSSVLQEL